MRLQLKVSILIATGFGSGLLRPASGTCGSLAALLCWWLLVSFTAAAHLGVQITLVVILTLLGTHASQILMREPPERLPDWLSARSGRKAPHTDPSYIVIDEWSGMWIALLGAPPDNYLAMAVAFFLFRLFDIWKPGPVRRAEQLPEAWGVMLDDVLAGFCALFVRIVFCVVLCPGEAIAWI